METLGERIKQKRKELGLRQEDLSGPLLSPAIKSLIERGKSNPSLKTSRLYVRPLGLFGEVMRNAVLPTGDSFASKHN